MLRLLILFSLAGTAFLSAADAAPAAATPYPFTSCIVSGEDLGSMGDAIVQVVDGREVKFCCKGCVKKFSKNQANYLQTIDTGAKAKAAGQEAVNPAATPAPGAKTGHQQ